MKLRATLGQMSSLFADPTQGSRLPDVGVDIHKLKEAIERNDKTYLLDVGELLRARVGMHSREAQAERNVKQAQSNNHKDKEDSDKAGTAGGKGSSSTMINMVEYTDNTKSSDQEPIFGSLTAKAERELLEKIRQSGDTLENGGLGLLSTPGSPRKDSASTANGSHTDAAAGTANASGLPAHAPTGGLFSVFGHTNAGDAPARDGNTSNQPPPVTQTGTGSSTGTPVDFNEYLHADLLSTSNSHSNLLGGLDFNQFLFPNGPSPPGFQLPDFTNLGSSMSSYNNLATGYPASNQFSHNQAASFLQPHLQHGAPSPAFGMSSSSNTPLPPKQLPTDGQITSNGISSFGTVPSVSSAGQGTLQLSALKEASKTLHKQAKQLIKL